MVVLLLMQLQPFTVLIRWLYCIVTSFTSCLHDIVFTHYNYDVGNYLNTTRHYLNLSPAVPGTKAQRHAKLRMSKQCSDCWVSLYKIYKWQEGHSKSDTQYLVYQLHTAVFWITIHSYTWERLAIGTRLTNTLGMFCRITSRTLRRLVS